MSTTSADEIDESIEHPVKIPLHPGDLHTRTMVTLVRQRVTSWNADPPTAAAAGVPTSRGELPKMDVLPGILAVPTIDEDGQKFPVGAKATVRVVRSLPLSDDVDPWSSAEDAARVVASFGPLLPPVDVTWRDVASDTTLELLAFQGLGAHRLEAIGDDRAGRPTSST